MAEQKSWMKAVITGSCEDEHGNVKQVDTTQEGEGIICITAMKDGCAGAVLGAWSTLRAMTALKCIKESLGEVMFTNAMQMLQLESILSVGEDDCSAEEADNERKAAEAAGEAHDGEEA